jgi:FAD dependent oxidoreductase TIGR03364
MEGYEGRVAAADLCVVGAGVIGLAHALEARRRGLRVVVLERDDRAVGASVRNFGHAFFGALADGDALECALASRARWLELGRAAGLHLVQAGTLVVARHEDELAVLEATSRNPARGQRMLTAAQAGALAPIPTGELAGALHGTLDLRLDPRDAVAGLARLLEQDAGAMIRWGEAAHEIEPGVVHAHSLTVRAPLIIVCPGPGYRDLPAALRAGTESLTRCKLQMLRLAAPAGRRYEPALATGLSLIRYPAFASVPEAAALRTRLQSQRPELLDAGIHLLVTQLPDGDLIVGDTHRYAETISPFREEALDELLLAEARRLLGAERLTVLERWQGIYASAPAGNFTITAPVDGVRVVQVVSGLGMTLAFGLAPRVLDELTGVSRPDQQAVTATRQPVAAPRGSAA